MSLGAVSSGLWFGVNRGSDAGKELLGGFGNLGAVHSCAHLEQFVGHPCFAFFQLLYSECGVCVYMHIYNKVIFWKKKKSVFSAFLFSVRGAEWGQTCPGAAL